MTETAVILAVASFVAASCALVGTFLVLRRMALLGDAISHAVLPGIVIAFLLTGDRSPLLMVVGAGALGVLTVLLVEVANRSRRLKEDASIGVVFPALFAVGVILVSRYAAQVDLDLDCVLYGEIAYTPWDFLEIGGRSLGPKALWVTGGVLLLDSVLVGVLYKELKLSTFDAQLATALGFSPVLLHYLLMSAVSVTVVGAFESVGAILVVAMLVVPAAAAYLLTDRLSAMLGLSIGLGVLSAWLGYGLSRWWDVSIAGAMASAAGALFVLSFLLAPRYGLLGRGLRHRRLSQAMEEQLLLLHLESGAEAGEMTGVGGLPGKEVARRFSWKPGHLRRIVRRLAHRGWLEVEADGLTLTPAGSAALQESGQQPLRHPPGEGRAA